MTILSAGKTDTGKTRQNNEDAYVIDDGTGLYAVADGIGGHEGGEVASRMAIDDLARTIREQSIGPDDTPPHGISAKGDALADALGRALMLANASIRKAASESPALAGMGTTVTALLFREGKAHLAHVGDSRAYRLRRGVLSQVTEDHTVIAEQLRAGLLTPAQARKSPYRHVITRALGIDPELSIDHRAIDVRTGDTFLLCTDGLTEMVDNAAIQQILSSAPPREAAELLVREANSRGGVDNITVVVIRITGDKDAAEPRRIGA
jgi:serine/threonine protein phosphatase PrpC